MSETRDGDRFGRQVLSELDFLYRVARSTTRNATDAEDLVQETLLAAYRGIGRFDGAHPRAWLCTVMRNAEAKRHRRHRPDPVADPEGAQARGRRGHPEAAPSPEELVVDARFEAAVEQGLVGLSPRLRKAVELVDLVGLTYAEAAEALGVPIGTVMSRLHRGRTRIRQRLTAAGLAPKRSMR